MSSISINTTGNEELSFREFQNDLYELAVTYNGEIFGKIAKNASEIYENKFMVEIIQEYAEAKRKERDARWDYFEELSSGDPKVAEIKETSVEFAHDTRMAYETVLYRTLVKHN